MPRPSLCLGICGLILCLVARTDDGLHVLWELRGRHNTVFLLGSIHVLRQSDYPLPSALLQAYAKADAVLMEVDLDQVNPQQLQTEMLAAAALPEGSTLSGVLGPQRYARAAALAREVGADLSQFDRFAPWFAAEAVSELQLTRLGFKSDAGVEMYFLGRARADGKSVAGLETVEDQISLFKDLPMDTQAGYLVSSLEEAQELPAELDSLVRAWQQGDTHWLETHLETELADDPRLYQAILGGRNRKWLPKIEALLDGDRNYLVIVGAGHLVGRGSVIDLLKQDGVGVTQR